MPDMSQPDTRYQARGVSAGKADVHAAIAGLDQGLFPGAFCKIIPDLLAQDEASCLLMHADGAGTKSSLAYLAWRETDDLAWWRGIAQDSLIMNIDDCACVGAIGPFLVSNTIGRNAKRIPGSVIKAIIDGYTACADMLAAEGIACHLTGGETADVGDLVRTVIADSTVMTRMPRSDVINAADMQAGDVIVSISGIGQARWETTANSGMGSNGLTAARHEALGGAYAEQYPETYAPEIAREFIYNGQHQLGDQLPGADMSVGQALLSPTRTYAPLIKAVLDEVGRADIHGIIHCSGGGQTKVGKFGQGRDGKGLSYIKDNLLPIPPLFTMLVEASGMTWQEAYAVFNCGARLEFIVAPHLADKIIAISQDCGLAAQISGRVEDRDQPGNEVVISGSHGTYTYPC
jgi:phosphoribosylformylglycinamidine cyclo-ligase